MKRAKIGDLKNNLSRYLDYVRSGGSVLVLDRDRPIAQIVPLHATGTADAQRDDEHLRRLERLGLIRRGKGGLPAWFGKRGPYRVHGSVLKDLLDERRSGW
jgi:antitoxin (DNA-binding transcriptional repressor) of toxin-antitoxin stability system